MRDANNINKFIGAKYRTYDISDTSHRTGITYSLQIGEHIMEISFSEKGDKEVRSDYEMTLNRATYFMIFHSSQKILIMDTNIDSLRAQYLGYKVIAKTNGDEHEYLIYLKDDLIYRFVTKDKLRNFHFSSILFPEVAELPDLIEAKGTRFELAEVFTRGQYEKLHRYLQLDIIKDYEILDYDDLRNAIQMQFGMDYDDFKQKIFDEIEGMRNRGNQ